MEMKFVLMITTPVNVLEKVTNYLQSHNAKIVNFKILPNKEITITVNVSKAPALLDRINALATVS